MIRSVYGSIHESDDPIIYIDKYGNDNFGCGRVRIVLKERARPIERGSHSEVGRKAFLNGII